MKAPFEPIAAHAPPTTSVEEERVSRGQRRISALWETTQSAIALLVIVSTLAAAAWIVVQDPSNRLMAFLFMSNVVSIVIGFYFGRTNHTKVGGVGPTGGER